MLTGSLLPSDIPSTAETTAATLNDDKFEVKESRLKNSSLGKFSNEAALVWQETNVPFAVWGPNSVGKHKIVTIHQRL
jgi:hypothetical protein